MVRLEELGGEEGDRSLALDERGDDRRDDNVRNFRTIRDAVDGSRIGVTPPAVTASEEAQPCESVWWSAPIPRNA
jgi:hypothetical protein